MGRPRLRLYCRPMLLLSIACTTPLRSLTIRRLGGSENAAAAGAGAACSEQQCRCAPEMGLDTKYAV